MAKSNYVKLHFYQYRRRIIMISAIVVLLCTALVTMITIRATTPTATSLEPEQGTISDSAIIVSDNGASNNAAIQFGSASSGFIHPGVMVGQPQLDFVKGKLAVNADPWKATLARTTSQKAMDGQIFGSLAYMPHPVAAIHCESAESDCEAMRDDAIAAYTHALTYYYSTASNRAEHAQKAIAILNAWSSTINSASGNQIKLEMGWAGAMFPRAAEIIRYSYNPAVGDEALNVTALKTMLLGVFKTQVKDGSPYSNGNWELSMAEAMINIGVFADDRPTFDAGIAMWRARVPAYIYMSSDNNSSGQPVAPPGGKYTNAASLKCFWLGAGTVVSSCGSPPNFAFVDGMVQETCRDISHVALGLSALTGAAETARLQSVDLYGEQQQRIIKAYEFSAQFNTTFLTNGTWPSQPCGGKPGLYGSSSAQTGDGTGGVGYKLGWEIAYNQFASRDGIAMPKTLSFITDYVRPTAYKASQGIAWEALTHAGTP